MHQTQQTTQHRTQVLQTRVLQILVELHQVQVGVRLLVQLQVGHHRVEVPHQVLQVVVLLKGVVGETLQVVEIVGHQVVIRVRHLVEIVEVVLIQVVEIVEEALIRVVGTTHPIIIVGTTLVIHQIMEIVPKIITIIQKETTMGKVKDKVIQMGAKVVVKSQTQKVLEKILPKKVAKPIAKKVGKVAKSLTQKIQNLMK